MRTTFRAAALAAILLVGTRAHAGPVVCTWGGTSDNPTGVVTFTPGLKWTPTLQPIPFTATGELAGEGCSDSEGNPRTMTFEGEQLPGSGCLSIRDWARVSGVPGVNFQETVGVFGGPILGVLYGPNGVAGSFSGHVYTGGTGPDACSTDAGFEQSRFSAYVLLF